MKKIFALVLAMLLVLGMTSAFAASISITHDATYEGATGTTARVYSAYKIFDAEYTGGLEGENTQAAKDTFTYDPANKAIAYSMATDSPWLSVMQASGQTWFNVDMAGNGSKYIITPKTGAMTTSAHAKAFGEYLQANIPSGATATDVTVDGDAASVNEGYYLIVGKDSKDAVTRVAVVTTDVTMVEKNTYITTGKTTAETSYNVGDTVTYTATVYIPSDTALTVTEGTGYKAGHGPVILHDSMDTRLTFSGTATATIGSTNFDGFTVSASPADGDTFDISIPVTSTVLGQTITFTYTATVNETAVNDVGFINELGGELNGYKTNPDDVHVYTFDFEFNKVFTGSSDTNLSATFEVRMDPDDATTAISFKTKPDKANGTKVLEKSADTDGSTTITIHNGERYDLVGLKADTYYLVETGTSVPYNLLKSPITVTINDTTTDPANPSHTVTYTDTEDDISGTGEITVTNNTGTVLPSTGGIGTTIFYIAGSILVLAAVIFLVTKRRMNANND